MSAYSTVYYTRTEAKRFIIDRIMDASPKDLEHIMDYFLEPALNNCIVTPDKEDY